MQVLLNTDHHADGKHEMAKHLTVVVEEAVYQFGVHVTKVVAHIADENIGAKTTADEIQCTLEAKLIGRDPVVVKESAGSVDQAIHGAAGKLKWAVGTALQRRSPWQAKRVSLTASDEFA